MATTELPPGRSISRYSRSLWAAYRCADRSNETGCPRLVASVTSARCRSVTPVSCRLSPCSRAFGAACGASGGLIARSLQRSDVEFLTSVGAARRRRLRRRSDEVSHRRYCLHFTEILIGSLLAILYGGQRILTQRLVASDYITHLAQRAFAINPKPVTRVEKLLKAITAVVAAAYILWATIAATTTANDGETPRSRANGASKRISSRPVKSKGRVPPLARFRRGRSPHASRQAVADSRARTESVRKRQDHRRGVSSAVAVDRCEPRRRRLATEGGRRRALIVLTAERRVPAGRSAVALAKGRRLVYLRHARGKNFVVLTPSLTRSARERDETSFRLIVVRPVKALPCYSTSRHEHRTGVRCEWLWTVAVGMTKNRSRPSRSLAHISSPSDRRRRNLQRPLERQNGERRVRL